MRLSLVIILILGSLVLLLPRVYFCSSAEQSCADTCKGHSSLEIRWLRILQESISIVINMATVIKNNVQSKEFDMQQKKNEVRFYSFIRSSQFAFYIIKLSFESPSRISRVECVIKFTSSWTLYRREHSCNSHLPLDSIFGVR